MNGLGVTAPAVAPGVGVDMAYGWYTQVDESGADITEEVHDQPYPDRVAALTPLLYAVLRTRAANPDLVDDMVQECLVRLLNLHDRLTPASLAGYAVVTARNVAATNARQVGRQQRHLPRLVDLRSPPDPGEEALKSEDSAALRNALAGLQAHDRDLLVAHDLDDIAVGRLARQSGSTPAALASRLNRTRGRLRVDYVVALQGARLPSRRCHSVLVALSTADHRRQTLLDASTHLAECATCAALSPPLVQRRRAALLLLPAAALFAGSRRVARSLRHHPVRSAAGAALAGSVAITVAIATAGTPTAATAVPTLHAGYYLVTSRGAVDAYGATAPRPPGMPAHLNKPIVAITATADGRGYWLAGSDGGVFTAGDAGYYGSAASLHLSEPVVGIAATPDRHGYWLVTGDGAVLTFGDARHYGARAPQQTTARIVGIAGSSDGRGYWEVSSTGSVRAFGDAAFYGQATETGHHRPIVAIAPTRSGNGYWLAASDGTIFAFGGAGFYGSQIRSPTPTERTVGISPTANGRGYWVANSNGDVERFGNAPSYGEEAQVPIVAVAETPPPK